MRVGQLFGLGIVVSCLLAGCSGGDGSRVPSEQPLLLRISAEGEAAPLWRGADVVSPACALGVAQNASLLFEFAGRVSVSSVPTSNVFGGAVSVADEFGVFPLGAWAVEDDPSLAMGNARRVRFRPDLAVGATLAPRGFAPGVRYEVRVENGGLIVAGSPLRGAANTCFTVCEPGQTSCLADFVPGAPFVVVTTPETGDPAVLGAVAGPTGAEDIVTVWFNEPLALAPPLNASHFRLVSVGTGAAVPGELFFFQAGSAEAGPSGARLDFRPQVALSPDRVYRIELGAGLVDFGGQTAVLYDPALGGPAGAQRLFRTVTATPITFTALDETFDTTARRASQSGAVEWSGNGFLSAGSSLEVFGNGAFGPLIVLAGQTVVIDTGMPPLLGVGGGLAFEMGAWNLTSLEVQATGVLRIVGNRPAHLRCLGPVSIEGRIEASAGSSAVAPVGSPEQGPQPGQFNNGGGIPGADVVQGGVAGPGGGRGGNASPEPGRAVRALTGEGSTVDGAPNLGPGSANPSFGGGEGGAGLVVFPASGAPGDIGGLGGAGGSGFTAGESPEPRTSVGTGCSLLAPVNAPLAGVTGPTLSFAPPVRAAAAGSGGGGGGDRFDSLVLGGTADEQGGGGGGGGGGLRVSSVGSITIGSTAIVRAHGSAGGLGNVFFGGAGGGGSGGLIWLQSAAEVLPSSTALIGAVGGVRVQSCSAQVSGAGGDGLLQLEDQDGEVLSNFLGPTLNNGNLVILSVPFGATTFGGTAISTFVDTGFQEVNYQSVVVERTLATVAAAVASLELQGAQVLLDGSGPDLLQLTPWVAESAFDQLDGFRFVRFRATLTYAALPAPPPGAVLPGLDRITIQASSF